MKLKTLMIGLIFSAQVNAQEQLQNESGLFAEQSVSAYNIILAKELLQDKNRKIQAVIVPSFKPEAAVYVLSDGNNSKVVVVRAKKSIWTSMEKNKKDLIGALKSKHEVERIEAPITMETLKSLEKTWVKFLNEVRSNEKSEIILDGTAYHFSNWSLDKGRPVSGFVHAPKEGTKTHDLSMLAESLVQFASLKESERASAEKELKSKAEALSK